VFRFALERWRADAYRVVVFHKGPLTDAEQELVKPLMEQQDHQISNMIVRTVDIDELESASGEEAQADKAFLANVTSPQYPFIAVQYPPHLRIDRPVWMGALEREAVARLIDSPARKELVRRLTAGQTAVWILLESGQKAQDEPVAEMLDREIKKLEESLELPELTPSPDDALEIQLPLEVKFSVLRVAKDDPAEAALVAMLIGAEPDLAERTDPMVFPVFGRGRALLPLIGAGISERNIHEASEFLAGPCSCEVKEQNPGFDLLLAAEWDILLSPSGAPLTTATVNSRVEPAEAEIVPIPRGSVSEPVVAKAVPASSASQSPPPRVRWIGIVLGGLAAVGVIVIAVFVTLAGSARTQT
jgi:hypothetical protein